MEAKTIIGKLGVVIMLFVFVSCFKEKLPEEFLAGDTGMALSFPYTGGKQSFKISSNTSWSIDVSKLPSWLLSAISPLEGEGDGIITVSLGQNISRLPLEHALTISYGTKSVANVYIFYDCIPNHAPSAPKIKFPENNAVQLSVVLPFEWEESTDADKDDVFYQVIYSKDKIHWDTSAVATASGAFLSSILDAGTRYYFKICARDIYNGEAFSDLYSFTTGPKDAYAGGEYSVYMRSPKNNPVNLIFMGDGYTAGAFRYNGAFDTDMNEGIEAFFNIEPYKSYRNYFTVYKIAAYSAESGMSDLLSGLTRKTVFSSAWLGGTKIQCDYDKVLDYAKRIDGINEKVLARSSIILLVNEDRYAGTCILWSDGSSIAMVPVCREEKGFMTHTHFRNVINHEAGGHGWGRLADEYINNNTEAPQSEINTLVKWQNEYNTYLNVSASPDASVVPWSQLIGRPGYDRVGIFEGALLYRYGLYRSEQTSCMIDNREYFNAQSRYLIVKRILETAGENFSMAVFLARDKANLDYSVSGTMEEPGIPYVPYDCLPPPVLIEK